ncbi:enoyl-CoA hydratase/isomerase [Novosphingobium nitrogenifigens DSM 19370]|uniref:Enoyl-CoA hydratase/isomerase n=1 Tax=Novosphingobium nitrogenifigens DSM 19370 TaxID=983920 RepID=F1ZDB4_9SPHN|nr:enoyl-CoA hydratase/isomerase family protein [Novosphingobium nitrogenifigens]EGD57444.1 enoyl-CoA hydratase/isomerase [Novosphingobium nitrogenifigens DSM 19370]
MISHAIANGIATIELTAAATRNALGLAGWRALSEAVAAIDTSAVRAVVVRSATDGMFCSGSDLREIIGLADDAAARAPFREIMRHALESLAGLPMPVVAEIDGDCFGAGVALALAADMRVAGPRARFAITPAKLGITYPQEDVARLVALVGPGQAGRLLYAAEVINTAEAARIGLVEVQADDALASAHGLAHAMAVQSPASLAALKQAVRRSPLGHDPALDAAFDGAFAGADFREGLLAFREKRRPRFADRG